jgi:hypothetical protein
MEDDVSFTIATFCLPPIFSFNRSSFTLLNRFNADLPAQVITVLQLAPRAVTHRHDIHMWAWTGIDCASGRLSDMHVNNIDGCEPFHVGYHSFKFQWNRGKMHEVKPIYDIDKCTVTIWESLMCEKKPGRSVAFDFGVTDAPTCYNTSAMYEYSGVAWRSVRMTCAYNPKDTEFTSEAEYYAIQSAERLRRPDHRPFGHTQREYEKDEWNFRGAYRQMPNWRGRLVEYGHPGCNKALRTQKTVSRNRCFPSEKGFKSFGFSLKRPEEKFAMPANATCNLQIWTDTACNSVRSMVVPFSQTACFDTSTMEGFTDATWHSYMWTCVPPKEPSRVRFITRRRDDNPPLNLATIMRLADMHHTERPTLTASSFEAAETRDSEEPEDQEFGFSEPTNFRSPNPRPRINGTPLSGWQTRTSSSTPIQTVAPTIRRRRDAGFNESQGEEERDLMEKTKETADEDDEDDENDSEEMEEKVDDAFENEKDD